MLPIRRPVWRNLLACCARGLLVVSVPIRRSLVRRAQVGVHGLGRLLRRRWFVFLDYAHHEYTPAGFRALLKENAFTVVRAFLLAAPSRAGGGAWLAFCATRE